MSRPDTQRSGDPFERNLLLRAISPADRQKLARHVEPIRLKRGDVLFEPGDEVTHVLFPCEGTVATLLVTLAEGHSIETATVGHEGAVGGVVNHGHLPAFNRAVVQIGGPAVRLSTARLQEAKQDSPALRNLIMRYADCLLAQVLQSVACNAVHSIEQRCARWLLSLQDRLGMEELPITQDILADMLGVRRSYLTAVLGGMSRNELVVLSRGKIGIRDRVALQNSACECHGRVRAHFSQVLGTVYRADGTVAAITSHPVENSGRAA